MNIWNKEGPQIPGSINLGRFIRWSPSFFLFFCLLSFCHDCKRLAGDTDSGAVDSGERGSCFLAVTVGKETISLLFIVLFTLFALAVMTATGVKLTTLSEPSHD